MVIGKTSESISISDVLNKFSETDILSYYFNIYTLPCCINSPLRKDRNPSFSLYLNREGRIRYIDFATDAHGDLIDLLCKYWSCSFTQALNHIYNDFIKESSVNIKPKSVKIFTRQEKNRLSKLEVKVRAWQDYDLAYWNSYGVSPQWLAYAEVYPISHKVITKIDENTGEKRRFTFLADKYAYVFVERKERRLQLKIYQPFNTKGFKWCSKMDSSVIALWAKLPKSGDRLVICSSLKDALCVAAQLHIPTIALQGEGYPISKTAVDELKQRFKKIFIAFDSDQAGVMDTKKLAEATGFISVFPSFGSEKDFSDYYKSLEDKNAFKCLAQLFQ